MSYMYKFQLLSFNVLTFILQWPLYIHAHTRHRPLCQEEREHCAPLNLHNAVIVFV